MTTHRLSIETAMIADSAQLLRFAEPAPPVAAGADLVFRGIVRDHDGGRGVRELECEAHPSAATMLRRAAEQVATGHPELIRVRVAHRRGQLQIGDCALFVEVCSPHRAGAFTARRRVVISDWKGH